MQNKLNDVELERYRIVALNVVEEGGSVLKHFWGNLIEIQDKNFIGDLVTEADRESERKILDLLRSEFPSHSFLAEESGTHGPEDARFQWVIDPLDGTTNYAHQYPMVALSVALLHFGEPVIGIVFNPIQNELFQAVQGRGATLNGKSLTVSKTTELNRSLLASGFAYDRRETLDNNYAEFCRLTDLTQGVRRGGSAALDLAYVAAGRCDGYWERGIKAWDIAAGILLVKEAGGRTTAYDESDLNLFDGKILATNGYIHHQLSQELIRNATASPVR